MSQPPRHAAFPTIATTAHDDPPRPSSTATTIPAWYHPLMVLDWWALSTKKSRRRSLSTRAAEKLRVRRVGKDRTDSSDWADHTNKC